MIDRPAGAANGNIDTGSPSVDRRQFDVTDFADLADVAPTSILDVRRHGEFAAHHIDGATNIPLHELLHRLDELTDQLTYVHCQSGCRASIAASILDRDGRDARHPAHGMLPGS
ncbi:MAG: rhodanese-like domain-containing protein [Ilumatobacter sp.]